MDYERLVKSFAYGAAWAIGFLAVLAFLGTLALFIFLSLVFKMVPIYA